MPVDGQVFEASGQSGSDASIYATTVGISGGSTTLTYSDIPGVEGSFDTPPTPILTNAAGDVGFSAIGETQMTITGSDGMASVLLLVED